MGDFVLGARSRKELIGVDSALVAVVERAIEITEQDFSVHDGLRTFVEQQALVRSGASKTLNSRHITGHAVDLVPYINGKLRWEWGPIFKIADAVRTAAKELGVSIRWGAAWDVTFTDTNSAPETIMREYAERRSNASKRVFLDGPHFELPEIR